MGKNGRGKALLTGLLFTSVLWTGTTRSEDWPWFRGPSRQGISQEKDVPTQWSAASNIRWKALIPGEGWGKIVGKILVWMVNVGELIVAQLGLQIPIWSVIAPMLMGLAQYFIGLAAKAEPSPS